MKIGLLLPSIYASPTLFPDKIFAPRELAIDLVNGLIARGHEVITFSVPDLPVKGKLISEPLEGITNVPPYFKFRDMEEGRRRFIEEEFAKHRFEIAVAAQAFSFAHKGFLDVLHVYMDSSMFISHYFEDLSHDLPVLYTLHDPLPPEGTYEWGELSRFCGHNYVSISNMFRQNPLKINFIDTVYHGIDPAAYPFNPEPSGNFLFLGRLVREKGLHSAMEAVRRTGANLTVSVNLPKEGETNGYFEKEIKLHLIDPRFTLCDVVDKVKRIELYRQAKALLFPIEWEEPFGIVLIEAMACGTPVIAYNRGSVGEIVKDGVTGYIIDPDDVTRPGKGSFIVKKQGLEGIVEAMGLISDIQRPACRRHVEEHFSVELMAANYERCYTSILK